jgi:hypothetical protein
MSASNLSRIELGAQGPPADEVIERIGLALKADPAELLRAAGRLDNIVRTVPTACALTRGSLHVPLSVRVDLVGVRAQRATLVSGSANS